MNETINMNNNERSARVVFATAILSHALSNTIEPEQFYLFNLLALYLLATALTAWDPVYAIFQRILKPFVRLLDALSMTKAY